MKATTSWSSSSASWVRSRPVGPLAPNTAIFISLFLVDMRPDHMSGSGYIKDGRVARSVTSARRMPVGGPRRRLEPPGSLLTDHRRQRRPATRTPIIEQPSVAAPVLTHLGRCPPGSVPCASPNPGQGRDARLSCALAGPRRDRRRPRLDGTAPLAGSSRRRCSCWLRPTAPGGRSKRTWHGPRALARCGVAGPTVEKRV